MMHGTINSFLSFSNQHINIKNIGISIGCEHDLVQSTISLITKVEKDRFKIPSVKASKINNADVDDSDGEIDHLALNHLALTEELTSFN